MGLAGLAAINLELSSRCSKKTLCAFCGHQDSATNPNLVYGDMSLELLQSIKSQIDVGISIFWHRDGEPTDHPHLKECLEMFMEFDTCLVTHGGNLVKKAKAIIDNCDVVTVSAFHADPDGPEQLEILKKFLRMKGDKRPRVMVKWVGDKFDEQYADLGITVIQRQLHDPDGNYHYSHRNPLIPEHGICLDFLHHPSISWNGDLFICNRLSTEKEGLLGNLNESTLEELWNSPRRIEWLDAHKRGRRDQASPLCHSCKFYGIPSSV